MVLADELATYAGAGAALLVAGAGWLYRLLAASIRSQIDESKNELTNLVDVETDKATHQFGETVSAIRSKISDMELWNRDNFVNNRTFETVVSDIRRLEDKIDRRFDAVDRKLSKMNGDNEN